MCTKMTTTQTAGRVCDYCGQPTRGLTVRAIPGDPNSKRTAFGDAHRNCLRLHLEAIDLQAAAEINAAVFEVMR